MKKQKKSELLNEVIGSGESACVRKQGSKGGFLKVARVSARRDKPGDNRRSQSSMLA